MLTDMTDSAGTNFRAAPGPSATSGRTGRIVLIVLAVIGAVVALRWLTQSEGPSEALFRTAPAEVRSIVQRVEATGRLRPRDPLLVLAPVEGRLAEVLVSARQSVKAGDRLARLDARSLAFEVGRAEAGVAAARGALAEAKAADVEAKQQRQRAERLAARGQLSQADRQAAVSVADRAKAAVQVASAKLSEAQASLRAARFATEQTDIVAPRDGVVLTVPNELGLAVSPRGPVLFTLSAPLEVLGLEASVGEADIGELAIGQPAEFEVQAYPRQKFTAQVEAIGVVAATNKGVATYPVQLTAPNEAGRLLPGMSASVRFEVARTADVLAVRDAALRFRPVDAQPGPPRSRVFKVSADGLVEEIKVEAGISDGVWVEVKPQTAGALQPGDNLAVGYLGGASGSTPGLKIGG
ncbi:MAG: efflux RND transporter periplasmic adaptor subunit [Myxococcota bacterium]